jgi:CubicO group peptidase (beta-lactamase class C family)
MNAWFTRIALGFLCFFACAKDPAKSPLVTSPTTDERALVETCLQSLPFKAQLAIALVQGKNVRYLGAEKTMEGIRFIDNRQGVFQIGSITKVFTATLFAQQVVKGNLGLEDPVQKHLPFRLKVSGRDGVEMTLKQLASHTSGIKHHQPPGFGFHAFFHSEPWKDFDQTRFESYLKNDLVLASKPGTAYLYTNLGMSLLGKILCLRTGRSYETMLQQDLFGPLNMGLSTTDVAKVKHRVVVGLDRKGKPMVNQDMNALAPCGGIYTCTEDLATFAQAQFEPADPAIVLSHKPIFTIEEGYHVALGWHRVDYAQGWRWINHNGGIGGYTASLNVDPKNRFAALVLCNVTNDDVPGEAVRKLCRELMKWMETSH